ncbi:MAG: hypothetical protein PW734_10895 [Verrucomicrobium sp.]|nr:hypothetical protein [Verrucomicrobium sp.]
MRGLLLIALLLAACSSAPGPAMRKGPGEGWTPLPTDNAASFQALDAALGKKIDIGDFHAYSDGQGSLKVTCQIRNLTERPLTVQVRVRFLGEENAVLYESPWQSVVLPMDKFIPFDATNGDGAQRAVVEMRLPVDD